MLNRQINVYSSASTDLMNWRYEGVAFRMPEQPLCQGPGANPSQPLTCYADRCKVLRNPTTGKYVMWCKSKPFASVAVADSATGPFRLVKLFNPGGHEVGDCTATSDPSNPSSAYFILSVHPSSYGFSRNDSRQVKIFSLTPDWTELSGEYRNVTAAWPLPNRYDGKLEAPAPFFDAEASRHYIWTSHCKLPRYRWHLGCILLTIPAISLRHRHVLVPERRGAAGCRGAILERAVEPARQPHPQRHLLAEP